MTKATTKARVERVVDGDTIDVTWLAGAELPARRVRLIGIDTPEVHQRLEPYGKEASRFTEKRLAGRVVWLEKDVSETDRYGRALRYVWLAEPPAEPTETIIRRDLFNAILLLEGYATPFTAPPDVKYADLFQAYAREARESGRGLWSSQLSTGQSSPGDAQWDAQSPGQDCDPSYPDVCIPPPPPDLDCGDIPHRRFRVGGSDPHGFDRDRDGVGCER